MFNGLEAAAEDFLICPCCGTEFGYHDARTSHEALRNRWLAEGMPWKSRVIHEPPGWSAEVQISLGAKLT